MSDLMTAYEIPAAGSAEVAVLHNGSVGLGGDGDRVSGTVTRIVDEGSVIVVDPGMVASREAALMASRELSISFADVVIPGHGAPFRPRKSA
jgi:hypothetical protein